MCIGPLAPKLPKTPAAQQIAAFDNGEATRAADQEARLRRQRAGAAARVLTSPLGIPADRGGTTTTLGGVAQ